MHVVREKQELPQCSFPEQKETNAERPSEEGQEWRRKELLIRELWKNWKC